MSAKESVSYTLLVALVLCLACSVVVAASFVILRPQQEFNKALDKRRNILLAAGLLPNNEDVDVNAIFEAKVKPRVIDLASGEYMDSINPETFDARQAAKEPETSVAVPPDRDIAGIRVRAEYNVVYEIYEGDQLATVVLPVHGKGLWSTLWGLLALEGDANTVVGLTFYEHAETPGLGGEIDNPAWRAIWPGKKLLDANGQYQLEVIKGQVNPQSSEAVHKVDGLSGATITTDGVDDLLRFWTNEDGYGAYLERLRSKGGSHG
ncbi:Na(+)-translocating NADH-quinone reductase subunit C [Oligoflexus tunisiensis]|uniref:Na(+)-translocating NADH-quinone reductase subunit C n=1 Tax=Oligoflexus tunisiensis TaxID=708132 RepID=UPI000A6EE4E1|nr:Na(+)-translocating NADH-quinone reductase subunit C [Oligoflexus tunisiensis]